MLTFITHGSDPRMERVRQTLQTLQSLDASVQVVEGDVEDYDNSLSVAVFVYDERTMRTSGRTFPLRKKSSCLCIGYMSNLYERLEMDPPAWAQHARVFIALWPSAPEETLGHAIADAVQTARKMLRVLNAPTGPSKRQQRSAAHRAWVASQKELPVLNRPSEAYIEALMERDGIIGS